ncbi:nucleotidyltransferase domain-containing protein [Mycetohabitans rhizoxinica]|uniref:nucleotidyltransferase domain-containing protein n=1 Tax=Mycetohabitans rhizoxinica TaxID=412963 RepID=UPI0030D2A1E8
MGYIKSHRPRYRTSDSDRYDVTDAILYGSRARRTHQADSDADVAVLLKGEHQ